MAIGDVTYYNRFLTELLKGLIDLHTAGDTIRVYLVDGYTPNKDDDVWSDISSNEIALSGYTVQTAANQVVTQNDTNDRAEFDLDDLDFGAIVSGTISHAVVVKWTGVASTSTLLKAIEAPDSTGSGNYKMLINAAGFDHFQQG